MAKRLGKATTQYNDWSGTIALDGGDDPAMSASVADLDVKEWTVCGIELYGSYEQSWAAVLAVRRDTVREFEDWRRMATGDPPAVPVMRVALPEGKGLDLLQTFKRWTVHAVLHDAIAAQGLDLEVAEEVGDGWPVPRAFLDDDGAS